MSDITSKKQKAFNKVTFNEYDYVSVESIGIQLIKFIDNNETVYTAELVKLIQNPHAKDPIAIIFPTAIESLDRNEVIIQAARMVIKLYGCNLFDFVPVIDLDKDDIVESLTVSEIVDQVIPEEDDTDEETQSDVPVVSQHLDDIPTDSFYIPSNIKTLH